MLKTRPHIHVSRFPQECALRLPINIGMGIVLHIPQYLGIWDHKHLLYGRLTKPYQVIYAYTWLQGLACGLGFATNSATCGRTELAGTSSVWMGVPTAKKTLLLPAVLERALSASTFSSTQVSSHQIKAKLCKSCMKWKGYNTFRSLLICMFLAINWNMRHNSQIWKAFHFDLVADFLTLCACPSTLAGTCASAKHDQSSCEVKHNLAVRHSRHRLHPEGDWGQDGRQIHRYWTAGKPCSPWRAHCPRSQSQPFPGMWPLILEQDLTPGCGPRAGEWKRQHISSLPPGTWVYWKNPSGPFIWLWEMTQSDL